MGQAVTRLISDDTQKSRSSNDWKAVASKHSFSKERGRRSKPSKPKQKANRPGISTAKPRSTTRQKPKRRHIDKQSMSSKHVRRPGKYSESRQALSSVRGSYSDKPSSKPASRLKGRDPEVLVSDTYRNRLPDKAQKLKKGNDAVALPRTKPSKKTIASQKAQSPRHGDQQQLNYKDIENHPPDDGRLRIDCVVCTEPKTTRHFPTQPPTTTCTHDAQTCTRCLRRWIQSEFEGKIWDQIDCPECRERMRYEDMRQFAPSSVFRKYERLATKAALEAIPGFRWCTGKGCTSGQVHDSGYDSPKFECVACHRRYCVVHNRRWHEGETCAEFDYRTDGTQKRVEEKASEKLIKETAKKCPGCKRNIEKTSGCDHMTCSKCRHQFCWICLAPYGPIRQQGNSMHLKTCNYYSPRNSEEL